VGIPAVSKNLKKDTRLVQLCGMVFLIFTVTGRCVQFCAGLKT